MTLAESFFPADRSVPLIDVSIGQLLIDAAADSPDTIALVDGVAAADQRRRWTYPQLLHAALGVAHELLARFEPGERVAIWGPSMPEWEIVQMGAALAGIAVVTVNPAYTAIELGYVLAQSRCAGIVMVPAYRDVDLFGVLDVARSAAPVPALREVLDLTTWRPTPTDDGHGLPAVAPHSVAMIQYTSGTTGFPKGAMLSHDGMVNNAMLFGRRFQLAPGSTWVNPLPMFHVGGCAFSTLGALCRRATHVLLAFEPQLALQLIEEERGTFLPAVPTMLMAMLEHPDFATFDLSSLEVVMSGGASIPPELVLRVESHMGAKFGAVFGQTETCGVICISHPSDSTPDKTLRVGQPLEQSEVKIVAAGSDIAVPCGEVGEICVRGFGVMVGYFDSAEQTAQAITTDGWLHTGDLGTMDDRGYLAVTGRLKEMIIRGGENIFPREIEDRLHEHPDVADAAVVGVPDARWGEEAVAFVRPAAGASPAPLELEAFLRERLAGHKVPRRWVMLDELPITLSGKVQKSGCGSSTRPVRSRRECRTSAPRAPARGIRRRCSARIESWRRPEPAWPRRRLIGVLFEGEQQSEPQELRVGDETLRLLAHVRAANKSSLLLKCQ